MFYRQCRCAAKYLLPLVQLLAIPAIVAAQMEATGRLTIAMPGKSSEGTLFCIGRQGQACYFLTAHHCAEKGATLSAEFFRSDALQRCYCTISSFEIVQTDASADIAILRVRTKQSLPIIPLHSGKPPRGSFAVSHVGCPGGSKPVFMEGEVIGTKPGYWTVDMAIGPGCSGGALVYEGKAIGIASHVGDFGYFSHLSAIQRMLKDNGLTDLDGQADTTVRRGATPPASQFAQPPLVPDYIPDVIVEGIRGRNGRFLAPPSLYTPPWLYPPSYGAPPSYYPPSYGPPDSFCPPSYCPPDSYCPPPSYYPPPSLYPPADAPYYAPGYRPFP